MNFLGFEDQTLFAEGVFAGLQRVLGYLVMGKQRHRDDHRFHVLVGQQLAIVLVLGRAGADGRGSLVHFRVVQIADRRASAVVHLGEMFQKIAAAAAHPDDTVFHLIGSGVDLQDGGRSIEAGNSHGGSGGGSGDASGFYDIAASGIGIFGHATPLNHRV